ncbi:MULTISPECIES: T9SS type A sorting domain-containing protein [unclassified Flavobacterium]|uniref:T9SS type A sorting domain-containing protein n=1 Tax=unclassified Flavobacterium TaxID=196869 RepID=UPI0012916853|nr:MULTISPECIES: T9SS type A sorting domain-containing protein [unclassified Flavobacterium]MQP53483.1 T9SS type A sorting domain-containing protein [Flavobacterium sp. LMO9]MQP63414.1 T9SS type A sorting domain-containing protein [Flavobacterium sp. LMO6]
MKIKLLSLKTCLFLFVFTLSGNAFATDYFVNNALTADDVYTTAAGNNANSGLTAALPKATLAAAISAASNGDRIFVDYGEYNEVGLNINKSVEIIGLGEELTVFKRTSGVNRWGVVSASNVKISKLTITNYNLASDGIALSITSGTEIEFNRVLVYANIGSAGQGAVLVSGAATSVTFRNSGSPCNRILSANYGGGYKIVGSTVVFDNCSINNNVVTSFNGGGLRVEGTTANVTINKCTFDDNSSQAGGGMCIVAGTVNINNSCFTGNIAAGNSNIDGGGAIFIQPGALTNVNISNTSFTNNQANNASADGGAISVKNTSGVTCNINFTTCSFTTNSCADRGEDIYFDQSFSPTFNVTFKNNTFFTVYSGTQVNIHNVDFPAASIKFEGLLTPTGTSGNGDIVASPNGVSIDKPEMSGAFTESSSSLPTSLPLTTCIDRFDGVCGTASATITCVTENKWDGSTWSKGTPTIFQHVILNANYNTQTNGNINACQMTVKSGVTLDIVDDTNGTYVYVVNSIFNNGTINVTSKANLVQVNHPLDLNDEPIATPNINFTKNTGNKIRWDYVYWSKPVSNSILPVFNSKFDIKYYWDPDFCVNGVNFSYEGWRSLVSEPTIGTGFITRVKSSAGTTPTNITLNYSGTSNNGDYTAIIKYYDTEHNAFRNFTLLGNPYPGAINFQNFYNDNQDKIYGTVYLWSANTPYPGMGLYQQADYASFNLTGGVGVPGASSQSPNGLLPNGYIASAQGFMVRAKVSGTVLFANSQRTKDIPSNNQFYRGVSQEKDRFWLRLLDSNGKYNELLIGYIKEATNDFDEAYDGPINSLSRIKFYSVLGNEKLIIQGRGEFVETDKVLVNYSITNPTSMLTISLNKKEGIFNTQKIYLFDKKLNFYHDLTQSDYFFYEDGTQDRFEIVYKLNKDDINENISDETSVIAFLNNGLLSIESNINISKVELYDVTGKIIFINEINNTSQFFHKNIAVSNGVYILNVVCENGVKKSIKILN